MQNQIPRAAYFEARDMLLIARAIEYGPRRMGRVWLQAFGTPPDPPKQKIPRVCHSLDNALELLRRNVTRGDCEQRELLREARALEIPKPYVYQARDILAKAGEIVIDRTGHYIVLRRAQNPQEPTCDPIDS